LSAKYVNADKADEGDKCVTSVTI